MSSNMSLEERMKTYYEGRTQVFLPRRTYTIIRIDGKAFHTYTKGFKKPFDETLIDCMDDTARLLCKEVSGTKFAYVQSDEISLVLTDFDKLGTQAWFDGKVQKMVSVAASIATAEFNRRMLMAEAIKASDQKEWQLLSDWEIEVMPMACFDARVFTVPDKEEVINYFIWRQQDAERNALQAVAQCNFSPKQLHGKSCVDMYEMLRNEKNIDFHDFPVNQRRGRLVSKFKLNPNSDMTGWLIPPETPLFKVERDNLIQLLTPEEETDGNTV